MVGNWIIGEIYQLDLEQKKRTFSERDLSILSSLDHKNRDPVCSASVSAVNGAINSFVRAAALELGDKLRINAISPVFVKETVEMMGMDSSSGMSAVDTAKAYEEALEGSMNGEVIDVRKYS